MAFPFLRSVFNNDPSNGLRLEPELKPEDVGGANPDREGVPFVPSSRQDLLHGCAEILRRIRLCYGRESEQFERDIMAIVVRYADFVNVLPATANNYYCYPGGLLRLGLDTAFFALQATDAQIFEGRATITQRRHLEPRWRQATFIAGLCTTLQPTLSTVVVKAASGTAWPSYLQALTSWIGGRGKLSFHLVWRPPAHVDGLQNLYALPHIIPPETMEYLADSNEVIVPTMLATLSRLPRSRPPSTMSALVRRAAALAIDKDLRRRAAARGDAMLGDHLGHLLVDIMHDLVHSAASWMPNAEKSRVWHAEDGTLVVWPDAYQDIAAYADRDRLYGLPLEPNSALAALRSAGMIVCDDANAAWAFRVPGASASRGCIKLAAPELVLGAQLLTCQPLPPLCLRRTHAHAATHHTGSDPAEPPSEPTRESVVVSEIENLSQLELSLDGQVDDEPPVDAGASAGSGAPLQTAPSLVNCLRLPAGVADLMRRAVGTLSAANDSVRARRVAEGVLIPMPLLRSTGLDTRMVVRCLRDAGMLVIEESGSATHTVSSDGVEVHGLILKTRFRDRP